ALDVCTGHEILLTADHDRICVPQPLFDDPQITVYSAHRYGSTLNDVLIVDNQQVLYALLTLDGVIRYFKHLLRWAQRHPYPNKHARQEHSVRVWHVASHLDSAGAWVDVIAEAVQCPRCGKPSSPTKAM